MKPEIRSSGIDQTDRTGRLLSSRIHEELFSDVRDKPLQGDAVRMSPIVAVLVAAALGYGGAQWLNSREGKIRRGPDGQRLSATKVALIDSSEVVDSNGEELLVVESVALCCT